MHMIARYIKPSMRRMIAGVIVKLLGTVIELFLPYILAHIIDDVTPLGDIRIVLMWGGAMLFCAVAAWGANVLANRNASAVARDTIEVLRHDLFNKIMYLSNRQIDWFSIPSLISRMTSDTYNIHRMIGMMQRIGIRAPILLIGGLIVTLTIDPVLSGILAAMIPLMIVLVFFITKKSLPMFSSLQGSVDELVRVVRENAGGVRVIKTLSKTAYERERFRGVNKQVVANENRANMTMGLSRPLLNLMFNVGLVLVIAAGAYRVNSGQIGAGVIVAFLTYFTLMLNAVLGVTRVLTMYSSSLASAARIEEVLNSSSELNISDFPREDSGAHVKFEHVDFSYDKKENNLSNISFELKRGESLGIIGPTGSGKSTIAALLLRLYDIDSGRITIDGRDIRSLPVKDLRDRFGVVFQGDAVFRDTIEGNIRLSREIDMEEVDKAIATAQAGDYIAQAGGLTHEVDAHGMNLSGGQKQRLLIARALAGRPEILILDDSSSALDYKTDANLRVGLHEGYGDTTTIIIAQRISSIRKCDRILVIEDGAELGLGTHDELMATCRLYQEISKLQMGDGEISQEG